MSENDILLSRDDTASAPRVAVLVVEDEPLVRMLVVEALEEAGYAVSEAPEAGSALDLLRADGPIALMVTDLGLPGLNGRQLSEQARALRPGLKVLYMTGYADGALLEAALPPGCDLIAKPFDLGHLAAKAAALLTV